VIPKLITGMARDGTLRPPPLERGLGVERNGPIVPVYDDGTLIAVAQPG
jgi:hypothetical protein